jgi:hypothetical protein
MSGAKSRSRQAALLILLYETGRFFAATTTYGQPHLFNHDGS